MNPSFRWLTQCWWIYGNYNLGGDKVSSQRFLETIQLRTGKMCTGQVFPRPPSSEIAAVDGYILFCCLTLIELISKQRQIIRTNKHVLILIYISVCIARHIHLRPQIQDCSAVLTFILSLDIDFWTLTKLLRFRVCLLVEIKRYKSTFRI